jgi:phage shock protein PspC (stress-responsive transcriptional regulator)
MFNFKKLKEFYKASNENKIQLFNILAFIVVPIAIMIILYILARHFYPEASL